MKNAWTEKIERLEAEKATLLEALRVAKTTLVDAQGEWLMVTETFSPEWTHPLEKAIEEINAAIAKTEKRTP